MIKNKWWLEPITWQQAEAIAKYYGIDREAAMLIYPTKGEATGAIKASYFGKALELARSHAMAGRLKEFGELKSYFVDDSEGGQNNLGKRDLQAIWEYIKKYIIKL